MGEHMETKSQTAQSEKFIETARAIGCDESEAAFKERLKKLMAAPRQVRAGQAEKGEALEMRA